MSFARVRSYRVALTGVFAAALVGGAVAVSLPADASAPNLLGNSSAEVVRRDVPTGWTKTFNGTNRHALSVVASGGKLGRRFVRTQITSWSSGGAWWATPAAAVRGGSTYTFTEYYRSGVSTRLLAAATVRGRTVWLPVGVAKPARAWTAASYTVTVPAGATQVRIAHVLQHVGTLDVDGVSLTLRSAGVTGRPAPASAHGAAATSASGLVSLTFDDGTTDHFTNAMPALTAHGEVGTFYLISGYLGNPSYLTVDQAKQIQAAGNEIGSHTVDHPELTTLTQAQLETEFGDSKKALEADFGSVTDLAYPYGASTALVRQIAAKYYSSARSTDGGLNVAGTYDPYQLTIGYVLNTTTLDTVKQWLADAKAHGSWLILCYHGVSDGRPNETYNVSVSTFNSQLAAVQASGVRNVTVRDGLKATGH